MGVVFLNGVGVVRLFVGDCISSVPLDLKMNSTGVPIVNFSGDSVHGINCFMREMGIPLEKKLMRASSWVISLRVTWFLN